MYHPLVVSCLCAHYDDKYRLNAFSFIACIFASSTLNLFFPRFPFTFDSHLPLLERNSLKKFTKKFGLEQVLSLNLYSSSGVTCFSNTCFAADGGNTCCTKAKIIYIAKVIKIQTVEK